MEILSWIFFIFSMLVIYAIIKVLSMLINIGRSINDKLRFIANELSEGEYDRLIENKEE